MLDKRWPEYNLPSYKIPLRTISQYNLLDVWDWYVTGASLRKFPKLKEEWEKWGTNIAAFLGDYLTACCCGEFRHVSVQACNLPRSINKFFFPKGPESNRSDWGPLMWKQFKCSRITALHYMENVFLKSSWKEGFGSKPWGFIAKWARKLIQNPSPYLVDLTFHLNHCNGGMMLQPKFDWVYDPYSPSFSPHLFYQFLMNKSFLCMQHLAFPPMDHRDKAIFHDYPVKFPQVYLHAHRHTCKVECEAQWYKRFNRNLGDFQEQLDYMREMNERFPREVMEDKEEECDDEECDDSQV
jgi:hypothetical protein